MSERVPSHARVVIIGGGIVGCSVAYHLTGLGWSDVVLLGVAGGAATGKRIRRLLTDREALKHA